MKNIHELRRRNMRELLKIFGSAYRIGEKLGFNTGRISNIMGKNPTRNIGEKLARSIEQRLDLTPDWLDQEHDEINSSPLAKHDEMLYNKVEYIKLLNVEASAGMGALVFDESIRALYPMPRESIKSAGVSLEKCCFIKVKGHCMAPQIEEGDYLLVDLGTTKILNGRIYAIRFNGEVMIKRLYQNVTGDIKLTCDNPLEKIYFPDTTLSKDQAEQYLHVIGEIFALQKLLR